MELEIQYRKEMNHDYLCLELNENAENNFRIHMLEKNQIAGLLPMTVRRVDEKLYGEYEITGLQSLEEYFQERRMDQFDIQLLLMRLTEIADTVEQYLLFGQEILLREKLIFTNTKYTELYFCYNPVQKEPVKDGLSRICRFILDHVNYEDHISVKMAYLLYQEGMKENVSAESLTMFLSGLIQQKEDDQRIESTTEPIRTVQSENVKKIRLQETFLKERKQESDQISAEKSEPERCQEKRQEISGAPFEQHEKGTVVQRESKILTDAQGKREKRVWIIGSGIIICGVLLGAGLYLLFRKELSDESRKILLIVLIILGAAILCMFVKFVSDQSD